jgi:hypothetical protein
MALEEKIEVAYIVAYCQKAKEKFKEVAKVC